MIELLALYSQALISGLLCAVALAILGCHLASRDQSLQSLVVSQAATVGVLFSAAVMLGNHSDITENPIPMITGVLMATLLYFLGEWLVVGKSASKTSVFLALFTIMLALSYWLISFFPALEGHMSKAFFGDIVTLTGVTLQFTTAVSTIALLALLLCWKQMANHSFIISVIGNAQIGNRGSLHLSNALTLLLISTSIYAMGLLFTIAYLLLPTVIFSFIRLPSIRLHLLLVTFTAAAGFVFGFILSLYFDRISTVPTIILTTACLGVLIQHAVNKHLHTIK